MYKQILSLFAIVALSALVVMFTPQSKSCLEHLLAAYNWVSSTLSDVFAGGSAGKISRDLVALLVIPVLAGLIPSLLYFVVRKHWFPYFMNVVWVVWLIQAGALIMTIAGSTT
jgi:hypothetical protein